MRYLLIAVSIFAYGCGNDVEPLHPIPNCGADCAIDYAGTLIIGERAFDVTCNVGKTVCETYEGTTTLTCPDFLPISDEVCDANNIDEDCSGIPNDIRYVWYDYRNSCDGIGECRYSEQVCNSDGKMICVPVSLLYGDEVCDGEDNDCDGFTDGEDSDLTYDSSDFQYRGDPTTLNIGECRAGVRRCEDGREYLFGEVLPTTEICGNDDDDDCDGLTDEDEGDGHAEAFVLVIDFSGSMYGTIEAVAEALCNWSNGNVFQNSKFAVRAVAGGYQNAPYIDSVVDFTTAGSACEAIRNFVDSNHLSGYNEFIPYAIWGLQNDTTFDLVWPDNMTRRVVFFTDEMPQGHIDTPESELFSVSQDCGPNNYTVGGFVGGQFSLWRTMTDPCHGWLETLSNDSDQMREDLEYRFGSECGAL